MNPDAKRSHLFYILYGHTPIPLYAAPYEIELIAWGKWRNKADTLVARTLIGEVDIITYFIGIPLANTSGAPLLFESTVFGGRFDGMQDRYATWDEAEAGHAKLVAKVKGGDPGDSAWQVPDLHDGAESLHINRVRRHNRQGFPRDAGDETDHTAAGGDQERTTMIRDQKVRVLIDGVRYDALVVMGSDNLRSLAVEVEDFKCRRIREGGMVTGPLLLSSEDGTNYRDVTSDLKVVVEAAELRSA